MFTFYIDSQRFTVIRCSALASTNPQRFPRDLNRFTKSNKFHCLSDFPARIQLICIVTAMVFNGLHRLSMICNDFHRFSLVLRFSGSQVLRFSCSMIYSMFTGSQVFSNAFNGFMTRLDLPTTIVQLLNDNPTVREPPSVQTAP